MFWINDRLAYILYILCGSCCIGCI